MQGISIQILKYINSKTIIFSCVIILAIHALNYIHSYSINFPLRDDWIPVFAALYFQQHDPIWINAIISSEGEHLQYFYRFVMMTGFLLDSFNVHSLMYLSWGLLSSSIGIIYIILRKTDEKIIWLIIPIAVLVYSPKLLNAALVASVGLSWIIIFFVFVSIVAILNKKIITKTWLIIGICLSTIATFNVVLGVLSWMIGIVFLILKFNQNKKNLLMWIVAMIIVLSLYFTIADLDQSQQQVQRTLVNTGNINWALEYISNPYSIPSDVARHLFGVASIISLIFISTYFIIKKVSKSYPWIMFGLIGIMSTLITTSGRFQVRLPSTDYYIIMSNFTQIAILVLITILFFEMKKSKKIKFYKVSKIMYVTFIIFMIALLIPTYYNGHNLGITRYDTTSTYLNCFKIPSDLKSCMSFVIDGDPKQSREKIEDILDVQNIMIEKKLSLFSDESFFSKQKKDRVILENLWNSLDEGKGVGDIYYLNEHRISNNQTVMLNDSHIFISGWINGNDGKINDMVLLIDEKPFLSSDKFSDIPQLMEEGHYRNGTKIIDIFHPKEGFTNEDINIIPPNRAWTIVFFPAFLENGCHKISIGGINENIKFKINKEFTLCK